MLRNHCHIFLFIPYHYHEPQGGNFDLHIFSIPKRWLRTIVQFLDLLRHFKGVKWFVMFGDHHMTQDNIFNNRCITFLLTYRSDVSFKKDILKTLGNQKIIKQSRSFITKRKICILGIATFRKRSLQHSQRDTWFTIKIVIKTTPLNYR